MNVLPDFDGLGGIGDLRTVAGALLTFVLITAVLMLIASAITWALVTTNGNQTSAVKSAPGFWSPSVPPSSKEPAWHG